MRWGLVLTLFFFGCSSSPATGSDASTDGPPQDANGSDVAAQDAETADSSDAGFDRSKATRIANFSETGPVHLDVCRKRATDPDSAYTPILKSLGLPPVPARSMSQYFTLPAYGAESTLRAIDGDVGDCSQGINTDHPNVMFDGGKYYVFVNTVLVDAIQADVPAPTAGQQTFLAFLAGPFNATITFGSTSITSAPATAAPGSGVISADFGTGAFTRSFTATAGGVATVAAFHPSTILVCDDLAPPQNGLTVCN